MQLGFVTASTDRELTEDDRLAVDALRAHDVRVSAVVWDETQAVTGVDAVVFRSCWNYHRMPDAWSAWIARLGTSGIPARNSATLVGWNTEKRYLQQLAERGIATPQTIWLAAGTSVSLAALLAQHGLEDAVVKPVVSMSGDDTFRVRRHDAASHQAALDALLRDRAMMVQAFVPEILTDGELSLVYFAGRYSHAVVKRPRSGEFRIHEEHGGTRRAFAAPPSLVSEGARVLAQLPEVPLYARVDGVMSRDRFVLMELEVIDPALYLASDAGAASRFAAAIAEWLK